VMVRIARNGKEIVASALANSGYESETPQVLLPIEAAEILNLWPPGTDYGKGFYRPDKGS
jgi:hypothetical protein